MTNEEKLKELEERIKDLECKVENLKFWITPPIYIPCKSLPEGDYVTHE
jgi:tetrahydromethanopterin S-methyltransferase subunit B